jgi:hypothetical protein
MSNRAPIADAVRVRRATCPSTASRTSATVASTTRFGVAVVPVTSPSATSAVTPPASSALASVTTSAGPSDGLSACRMAAASSPSRAAV